MAKETEPQPSAPGPEASTTPTTESTPTAQLRRYLVRWRFEGFRPEPLMEGDEVKATEEEAAPYLGGVLAELPAEP